MKKTSVQQTPQVVHKTISVVKDLPAELSGRHENNENGFWVWATKEIMDAVGDVVRVDGVDFGTYHSPPDTHLKVLAQHIRALPDGTAPVVGIVTDFLKTSAPYKGQMVKAIALYVEWLRGEDDKLLPLSQHYYDMVKAGGIDSGSVGMLVTDLEPMDNGGYDIKASTLFEFSLVTVPANAGATVIKELEQKLGCKIEVEPQDAPEASTEAPEPTVEPVVPIKEPSEPADEGYKALEAFTKAVEEQLKQLCDNFKTISERLDVIESSLVVLSQPQSEPEQKQIEVKPEPQKIDSGQLQQMKAILDHLTTFLER